ncbi:MAG TPA: thioredoxin family protein [Polyangiaceae bacterium]|jgi:hypothetical protein
MPHTPSDPLALGTLLPPVRLVNAIDGAEVDVDALRKGKKGTLLFVVCNHCPYVVHIRAELVKTAHEALDRGFAVVAVNANDPEGYPQDAPPAMAKLAKGEGWRFPFLFDEAQTVVRALHAESTPESFVFDASGKLAYRGQFDDSRPSNGKPVTGRDVRAALDAVAEGRAPSTNQTPSVGCSIKWRR